MPNGYTSQPTNEELIDFVVLLTNGKDIYPDRVGRVDLFDRHPAAIIRDSIHSGHLLPCMLGTCEYYLYYYKVPNEAEWGYDYHQIQDHSKGVWELTNIIKSSLPTFLTTQHNCKKNKDSATNL
ncbi:ubiquitin-conjugating enzyme E2 2 [Tanacetum coccineum]